MRDSIIPPEAGRARAARAAIQTSISLALALAIGAAWLTIHVFAVFYVKVSSQWELIPVIVALQCWLYVGLFIVAHDCMHGSFAPHRPRLNAFIGQLALFVYAGFPFARLSDKHHQHHRFAGTGADPDFDDRPPHGFWLWYTSFFQEYLSWRQPLLFGSALTFYATVLVVGATLHFWDLPSALSARRAVLGPPSRANQRLWLACVARNVLPFWVSS